MPDKKITDSEIVKALEHCVQKFSCTSCPLYKSKSSCGGYFLEVINRLQARIDHNSHNMKHLVKSVRDYQKALEKAKAENKKLKADCENYKQVAENQQKATLDKAFEIKRLKEEIERLKKEKERCFYCTEQANKKINEIKAEAYKEFAERLKETFPKDDFLRSTKQISADIDNLLEEMIGE